MRRWKIVIIGIMIALLVGLPVWGNAAEPPSVLIIVPGAPDELVVSMGQGETYLEGERRDKVFESYFLFFHQETVDLSELKIDAKSADYEISIAIGDVEQKYRNVYTLDLEDVSLIEGKDPVRSALYTSMRVVLTLIIEGLVFLIFRFREKRSWIIFLAINLISQGGLNLWINTVVYDDYSLLFGLVFFEFIILIVELIGFLALLREHSRWRIALYVILANILSLIAGGYIISILPY